MVSWPHMLDAWAKHAVNTGEWRLFMAVGSREPETTYPGLARSLLATRRTPPGGAPSLSLSSLCSLLPQCSSMPVQSRSATTLGALASQTPTLPIYTVGLRESLWAAPRPPGRASLGACHSLLCDCFACLNWLWAEGWHFGFWPCLLCFQP